MARSRREQREQLQQAVQSKTPEKPMPERQARADAPGSATQSARNESSARGFSTDPSPFTQRPTLSPDSSAYHELVAIAAYYRAERRGFAPGGDLEDWLQAEREVAAWLNEPPANLARAQV